jgi:hypothetical protein
VHCATLLTKSSGAGLLALDQPGDDTLQALLLPGSHAVVGGIAAGGEQVFMRPSSRQPEGPATSLARARIVGMALCTSSGSSDSAGPAAEPAGDSSAAASGQQQGAAAGGSSGGSKSVRAAALSVHGYAACQAKEVWHGVELQRRWGTTQSGVSRLLHCAVLCCTHLLLAARHCSSLQPLRPGSHALHDLCKPARPAACPPNYLPTYQPTWQPGPHAHWAEPSCTVHSSCTVITTNAPRPPPPHPLHPTPHAHHHSSPHPPLTPQEEAALLEGGISSDSSRSMSLPTCVLAAAQAREDPSIALWTVPADQPLLTYAQATQSGGCGALPGQVGPGWWCCLVLPGAAWCCLVLPGAAWCCLVLPGAAGATSAPARPYAQQPTPSAPGTRPDAAPLLPPAAGRPLVLAQVLSFVEGGQQGSAAVVLQVDHDEAGDLDVMMKEVEGAQRHRLCCQVVAGSGPAALEVMRRELPLLRSMCRHEGDEGGEVGCWRALEQEWRAVLQRSALAVGARSGSAGLSVFSCTGRGRGMHKCAAAEAAAIDQALQRGVPFAGAYCNGELGPIMKAGYCGWGSGEEVAGQEGLVQAGRGAAPTFMSSVLQGFTTMFGMMG